MVEDKRDILKRIITALAEFKDRLDNQGEVGRKYQEWREDLYKKMTHYEICKEILQPISKEDNNQNNKEVDDASKSKTIINNDEPEPMKD